MNNVSPLQYYYARAATNVSDINEHIPTLKEYASKCETIAELGVSVCTSTWAFLQGLHENNAPVKKLVSIDVNYHPSIDEAGKVAKVNNIEFVFLQGNDLHIDMQISDVDMTFIDTWHVYGQLKRELEKFAPITKKYIVMHDTTIDAERGESLRDNHDIHARSRESGIPVYEITKGLRYAIEEFLASNSDWMVELVKRNNNGLTVLTRRS